MYDAIIVGARCAGSATAMLLARAGHRVLLVDRAAFPSDTLSTHYIHRPGVAHLARWGLLERVAASGCPPVRHQVLDFGPIRLRGAPPPIDGVAHGYAPRRTVLDTLLVEAAVEAGVELREHFSVRELTRDGDRVTGVRGRGRTGSDVTEQARIVIGADGQHSLVARMVGAERYHETPALTCAYYTYWEGATLDEVNLYSRPNQALIAAPTNDGKTLGIIYWPREQFHTVRADVEGSYHAALDLAPDLRDRLLAGERAEPFRGTADLDSFFRRAYGPGWALVGDAGCHKDPILAQGISDAFFQAQALADAVSAGLSGSEPLDDALATFEQRRDTHLRPLFDMSVDLARMAPPAPEMQALIAALPDNPEQTDRFIGVVAGTVPAAEFFAPENLGAILGLAPADVA